jgi:hypothetical protein
MTIRRSTPLRNAQAGQRAQIKNVILVIDLFLVTIVSTI